MSNSKLYFLNPERGLYYADVETAAETNVVNGYIFKNIWTDNLNNVMFTAVDSNLQTVNGRINIDGDIELNFIPNSFDIVYIKPLN